MSDAFGDALEWPFASYLLKHDLGEIVRAKGQQHPIPALRVRVNAEHMLTVEIFERVRHQSILPQHGDDIVGPEDEISEIASIEPLNPAEGAKAGLDLARGGVQLSLLLEVVAEIRPEMLDTELRLLDRVETGDQLVEPCFAHDQYNLAVGGLHGSMPGLRLQHLAQEIRGDVELADLGRIVGEVAEGERHELPRAHARRGERLKNLRIGVAE